MSSTTWKRRANDAYDPVMKDARNTDIIIPIIGSIGVGKSKFINTLLEEESVVIVGHELTCCTEELKPLIVPCPPGTPGRLVFVDTPGFDPELDDSEILRRISVWLAASYSDSMKLGGVIYLYDITLPRLLGTREREATRTAINVFMKGYGHDSLKSVVLATTKWKIIDTAIVGVGQYREEMLEDNQWKEMLNAGAQKFRFCDDKESAWNIVNAIIDRYKKSSLDPKPR